MYSKYLSIISRNLLASSTTQEPIEEREREDGDVLILAFFLLTFGIIIGFLYETYFIFKKIERYFPHASANMILGFFVGLILSIVGFLTKDFAFSSEFFFQYLLPPIIFSAGYNLPKDFFFHNFGSIMTFAFVGTALSAFFIGASLTAFGALGIIENLSFTKNMMMGSLISAVDPVAVILVLKSLNVDSQLKVLLFGESVLNDAAAVVINRVFVDIEQGGSTTSEALAPAIPKIIGIAIASMLIGTLIALIVASIHKYTKMKSKKIYEIELAAFLIGAFLPYGVAEAAGLSGICSVLFAGIMTDYYTYHHLSKQSQITTRHMVKTLAYISELFVFIYLGMTFFLEEGHEFRGGYVIITLILCFIGRAISVFPLAFLLNIGRKHKLPFKHQIVLWYSGLRGPVAYALAKATPSDSLSPDDDNIIITTTIFIVAFTTLMLGGLAYPFLRWVKPPIMKSTTQTKTDTYDISNHWFNRLDRRFLRPYFGPKIRRNVNHPLTSMDEIEMDDKLRKKGGNIHDASSSGNTNNENDNTQFISHGIDNNNNKYDMKYINTNTNDTDDNDNDNDGDGDTDDIKHDNDDKGKLQKSKDVHLQIHSNINKIVSESKSIVDYSNARTKAPSFIDNPQQEQSQSGDTWSDINNKQINIGSTTPHLSANNNNNNNSTNTLDPPQINAKSVTPPPNNPDDNY